MEPLPATSEISDYDLALSDGWRLRLEAEALTVSKADGSEAQRVPRAQALAVVERIGLRFTSPAFVLREPKRRVFKLQPEQARIFDEWLGPDFGPELRHQLKHRMGQALPTGLFFVLTAGLDPVSWALGALLLLQGILSRKRPSHWLFLLEILFWVGALVRNIVSLAINPGPLACIFGLLCLFFLSISLAMFRRFHEALRASPASAGRA